KVRAEAALGEISGKIKSLENELGADADAADNQISGLQLTVARLESAQKKLGEIAGLQARSNALEGSIREAEQNIADIGGRIAASEDRAENGRKVVAECERSAQGFGEIEARRGELREVCAKFAELSRLEDELAAAELRLPPLEKALAAAREELDAATSRLESLHTAHRRDAAYALSRGLSEGEPCPVCGSAAHPNPASPASGAPGEEEIRGAEKSADLLRKNLEKALAEKNTVSAETAVIARNLEAARHGELIRGRSKDEAGSQFKLADEKYISIKKQIEAIPQYRAKIREIEEDTAKLAAGREELSNRLSVMRQELAGLNASEASALEDVPENLRDEGVLTGEIAGKRRALAELTAKRAAHTEARMEQSRREAAAKAAAVRADETAQALSGARQSYQKHLDEHNNGDYSRDLPPDPDGLKLKGKALADELTGLARRTGEEAQRLRSLIDTSKKLADEAEKKRSAILRRQQLETLKKWLFGDNPRKTPIDQFVAGLLLDEVLAVANHYFATLSRGQYALRRAEESQGHGHQGVNFEVVDSHIGGVRQLSTLSGGELFLASLSLAFALTDVVQSFSGGVSLGSLFIDEGFGSLDRDTLEVCMDALSELRGGRVIGIISHVEELRQRIPAQIRVTKDGTSSRIEVRI
ncbi:MAG: SMC family ATPase, partial [Oscillospiraceae bacterium]|nr:SMC family ATPase [Oscillospiraceae bacterium]